MAQQVKGLAVKADDLSLILEAPMVEEEKQFLQAVFWHPTSTNKVHFSSLGGCLFLDYGLPFLRISASHFVSRALGFINAEWILVEN